MKNGWKCKRAEVIIQIPYASLSSMRFIAGCMHVRWVSVYICTYVCVCIYGRQPRKEQHEQRLAWMTVIVSWKCPPFRSAEIGHLEHSTATTLSPYWGWPTSPITSTSPAIYSHFTIISSLLSAHTHTHTHAHIHSYHHCQIETLWLNFLYVYFFFTVFENNSYHLHCEKFEWRMD